MRFPWLAFAVAVAAGCGGAGANARLAPTVKPAAPTPAEPMPPSFGLHPGEQMTFTVTLGGVEAGEAAFAVGQPGDIDGHHAIKVSSRIASAGVFKLVKDIEDDLTSTIDLDTGLPFEIQADVKFPPNDFHATGTFAGPVVDFDWHKGDNKLRHTHYDFRDVDAHDSHSAMAAVRTWEANIGDTRRLYVVGGRRIWATDVTWAGRETIGTSMGNVAAVRLDGVSQRVTPGLDPMSSIEPRTFSVWMSDDGDRVPLRVVAHTELGDVVIELTGYERP